MNSPKKEIDLIDLLTALHAGRQHPSPRTRGAVSLDKTPRSATE